MKQWRRGDTPPPSDNRGGDDDDLLVIDGDDNCISEGDFIDNEKEDDNKERIEPSQIGKIVT